MSTKGYSSWTRGGRLPEVPAQYICFLACVWIFGFHICWRRFRACLCCRTFVISLFIGISCTEKVAKSSIPTFSIIVMKSQYVAVDMEEDKLIYCNQPYRTCLVAAAPLLPRFQYSDSRVGCRLDTFDSFPFCLINVQVPAKGNTRATLYPA